MTYSSKDSFKINCVSLDFYLSISSFPRIASFLRTHHLWEKLFNQRHWHISSSHD